MPSELRVDKVSSTASPYTPVFSTTGGALSHRNMVINGAMLVAQRGNVTGKTSSTYGGPDRFKTEINALGTWSISQNTTNTPTDKGFKNSLKLEITANAESSIGGTSDYVNLQQRFEGQDVQHIRKGTSEAKQLTLSFWVKSNVTGNYNIELTDVDNSRHVTVLSTIDSADTWEYKTHTFPADTTGAFDNDNVQSLRIAWWLSAGTTFTSGSRQTTWSSTSNGDRAVGNFNLASANNNYYEITGVQLELGSVATPFEHRSYGEELARCQRYYNQLDTAEGGGYRVYEVYGTTGGADCNFCLGIHKPMRVTPTATATGQITANISNYGGLVSEQGMINVAGTYSAAGRSYWQQNTADANGQRIIKIDAEL